MHKLIGKPQVLKEINSSMVEQLIYHNGPLTKPQLAKLTKLSLPTVNKLVDDLEAQGSIKQAGITGKGTGRKAKMYEPDRSFGCLIVLYYRWETYIGRLTDITGRTLLEERRPLDTSTAAAALKSTIAAIDSLMANAPAQIKSIGIGVPGVVLPNGQLSGIPKIEVWEGFHLAEALRLRYTADIWVENDVKLAAVGYYYANLTKQYEHLVYIYAGNGMGSGIILNRKLFRGASNYSGELGYMAPLSADEPKEAYTTKGGYLESRLRQFINREREEFKLIIEPEQRQALVNLLVGAAANYIAVLNPDVIVFGGEAFNDALIKEIEQQITVYAVQESMPQILYDNNNDTGIEGLVSTCRESITVRMQLVQDGGV